MKKNKDIDIEYTKVEGRVRKGKTKIYGYDQ